MPQGLVAGLSNDPEIQGRVVDYVREHGSDTSFTEFFWKRCEPHPTELRRYPLNADTLRLMAGGRSKAEIAGITGVNWRSVWAWTGFRQKPKLAHYLSVYLQLGEPRQDWVWLSINNTSGHAIPLGPMIQVPRAISNWEEVAAVLEQS